MRLARGLSGLVVLALGVWAVWPRAADADLRQTYTRLWSAPVPPLLIGGTLPRGATAAVTADGYAFQAELPDLGHVSIDGRAARVDARAPTVGLAVRGHPAEVDVTSADATSIVWQETGATYRLTVAGRPDDARLQAIGQRVVALPDATRDAFGFGWDTPLLYLVYLPLFVGFVGWASGRLLAR